MREPDPGRGQLGAQRDEQEEAGHHLARGPTGRAAAAPLYFFGAMLLFHVSR